MTTKRPTWESVLADARTRGFVTVAEMAEELGIKWDHVLTWLNNAGVELVDLLPAGAKAYRHLAATRKALGIAGRAGVYMPDDEAVEDGIPGVDRPDRGRECRRQRGSRGRVSTAAAGAGRPQGRPGPRPTRLSGMVKGRTCSGGE